MTTRLLTLALLMVSAVTAQTFPVAGVLIDANTRSPLRRYRVILVPASARTRETAVTSGADGAFSFNVTQGAYVLSAEHGVTRQGYGFAAPGVGFGSQVIVGANQDTAHLEFRWFAPGAIVGKVTDSTGEPLEHALVQLVRVTVFNGRRLRAVAARGYTNDLGEYRFGGIAAGAFYLAVSAEPWYTARRQASSAVAASALSQPKELGVFPLTYFPNSTNPAGAALLALGPGEEVRADFSLVKMPAANVKLNFQRGGNIGTITLAAEAMPGVEIIARQASTFGASTQTLYAVPPGHYVVQVAGGGTETPFSARKTIDVGSADLEVDMTTVTAAKVSAQIVFKNPARPPRSALYFRLALEPIGSTLSREIQANGTAAISPVPAGKYRVLVAGSEGFFISQLTAEGATLDGSVLDVADGAQIKLNAVVSDESGELKGFAIRGEKPAPAVLAVLIPRASSADLSAYRSYQTESDGSFDFRNVQAGEYVLFAVEKLDLEYTNADVARPYLGAGKPVRIEPHATLTERIAVK